MKTIRTAIGEVCPVGDRNGKTLLLWIFILLGLFCLFPGEAKAETVYFQGFEEADPPDLPAGCSVEELWEGSKSKWATRRFGWHPYGVLPHSGSNMAYFDSASWVTGGARLILDGPLYLEGYSKLTLSIWVYHDNQRESFDLINLQVSTDGGENWQYIGDEILRYSTDVGWKEERIDLSSFAGSPALLIGIRGLSYFGNDIHVDDISVTTGDEIGGTEGDDGSGGCSTGTLEPMFLLLLLPLGLLGRKAR